MKFELKKSLRGAPDSELLDDLRRCAKRIGRDTITIAEYGEMGRAHPSTIQRRFGSWMKALEMAGLKPSRSEIGISDDKLFTNLKVIWEALGRQPSYMEVRAPVSAYSAGTYENRFGSWSRALQEFVEWVNGEKPYVPTDTTESEHAASPKRRTKREISERQRFRILVRDGFRCKACGASPLDNPGTELHVDHILPWSRGGETVDENLATKCKRCNLGKGNAFDV